MKHKLTGKHWLYTILYPHVIPMLYLFYRQVKYKGLEKLPKKQPVFLAPNHQNAFMDALILIPAFGPIRQISYLVRASIFGSKLGDAFLHRLHMLPVYRQIDGVENLGKNEEIFENCIWLMENKRVLTLFPEGTHNLKRQLLPLKKGVTRIALSAEERNDFKLDIVVFPVGLYYTNLSNYGGKVFVNFGDPIYIKEYESVYKENPNKVHNQIKSLLEKSLSKLMINIENNHYYDCIELCRLMDANEKGITDVEADFENSKILIDKIQNLVVVDEEKAVQLKSLSERYSAIITKNEFRDKLFSKKYKIPGFFERSLFLLLSPLGIYGWINNYLPFKIPHLLAEKKIKDRGFRSSIKSAGAMVFFPVFHLSQSSIVGIVTGNWWYALAYFGSLPVTFFIGVWWKRKIKRFTAYGRFKVLKNSPEISEAIQQRKEMISILNSL